MPEALICPECGSTDTYTDEIKVPLYHGDVRTVVGYSHCRRCEQEAESGGWLVRTELGDPWVRIDRGESAVGKVL